ncbi:hypothetical protein GLOTRDRAFT_108364 [Gloeophyllum trabeum ATCC 11539]|uniref:T6SS Phospholipase effector Tle1-like catalytic domain-containing protein n=1 Tax=Gloeophyllum trabeum (strain ATCC 11539 / FP-39264 / Madison 617) TaxID=670483 RepID=S7PUN0_GLOTA|nr:uncharacterized protein GLOTRDRAFT_108364 [Gloeophyllum trabeum ATCC 11539]EPQ51108.1 hypothetical protein GLOTRDRAFT_108364 [Gloeophyllum trabeum ATCC 11539]
MSMSTVSTDGPTAPRKPRTIILCFDGTSNQYDGDNTNVVNFFSLLKKDDFDEQLCYYQPGVGTYFNPGAISPLFQWVAKIADEAVAWYLNEHVMDGYRFLMSNYRVGDKICLFGFSRGAYTARALAGMLHKVGLLPKDNDAQVPFAYKLYSRTDKTGLELCQGFKRMFCQNVQVEFVGVWDTVASVGVIMGKTLPFTTSNTTIKTFRHALSLDEHRAKFRPNLYHRPAPDDKAASKDPEHASPPMSTAATFASAASLLDGKRTAGVKLKRLFSASGKKKQQAKGQNDGAVKEGDVGDTAERGDADSAARKNERSEVQVREDGPGDAAFLSPDDPAAPDLPRANSQDVISGGTDVKEVWFSGCHSDVGGGAVPNSTAHSLGDITLRWMVREVTISQCGILFEEAALKRLNIPEYGLTPIHDELGWKGKWAWWLLEIVPTSYAWQDKDGVWHKTWSIHFGRGRNIPDPNPQFHTTVKERMEGAHLKYRPRAKWSGTPEYVLD